MALTAAPFPHYNARTRPGPVPHPSVEVPVLHDSILEAIGNTPMVRLHRVGAGLECNLFGKCEFLNPGGSVKDRIGYQMVIDAEKSGRIKPGSRSPTAGAGSQAKTSSR